ncbi:MAG: CAP domain-containing protein [Planctomycetota bacterium]
MKHLAIILAILGILILPAACSKSHKSDRGGAIGTGTTPIGTGTSTGPTGTGTGGGGTGGGGEVGGPEALALLDALNAERASLGMGQLSWDGSIAAVAQAYADWMRVNKEGWYWQEDHDGKNCKIRLTEGGVTYNDAGEFGICDDGGPETAEMFMIYANGDYRAEATIFNPVFTKCGIGFNTYDVTYYG